MPSEQESLKRLSTDIVTLVEPDDVFVVEDNFDAMITDWHRAVSQDEGRFIGGAEIATFAAAVVPFLLTFLGDVAKDVIKDQAKKAAGTLLDKLLKRQASADEATHLRTEIEVAIAKSKVAREQKDVLNAGFDVLFSKLKPTE
ncbi:hypothetical protein ACSFA2_04500 [Variovorax sp. LT2P21]|uniref:hypothetical protein n=1 Tax=Variovorax sp. LT2P21 TaxID=3443731 RepID=UPI003F487BCA